MTDDNEMLALGKNSQRSAQVGYVVCLRLVDRSLEDESATKRHLNHVDQNGKTRRLANISRPIMARRLLKPA